MQIGIPVPSLAQILVAFCLALFLRPKTAKFLESVDVCFICTVREPTSALKNFSQIFNFLINTSYVFWISGII